MSLLTNTAITEGYNVMVNSEELICITECLTLGGVAISSVVITGFDLVKKKKLKFQATCHSS